MRLASLLVPLLKLPFSSGQSQTHRVPTAETFKASVVAFQKDVPNIGRQLADITFDNIRINYAEGDVINRDLAIVKQNLEVASSLSGEDCLQRQPWG